VAHVPLNTLIPLSATTKAKAKERGLGSLGWVPRSIGLVLAAGPFVAACSSSAPPQAPAPAASSGAGTLRPVPGGAAAAGWEAGKWGTFHSQRYDFRLALPDGKAWRIDDHKTSWLMASHAPTQSSLRARMFLTDHAQNRAKCEAKVREAEPALPTPRTDQAFDDASANVLADARWDTRAVSFVEAVSPPKGGVAVGSPGVEPLRGTVLVFASNVRKCFGFQFVTEATGPNARATVAARLADVRERVVRELRFDHELDVPGREVLSADGPR
jgi:hypothetical protein